MSEATWYIAVAQGARRIINGRLQFMAEHHLARHGGEVFVSIETVKEWIRNRPKLKDRPLLDRYLFVRGLQPWTIPHVEGVQCLILDADGLPAEIPDAALERFRPKPTDKPKVRIFLRGQRVRVIGGVLEGSTFAVQTHRHRQRLVTLDTDTGYVRLPDSLVEPIQ